ncbi:S-adenosyl-L-methionine-dependentmethyltransferases superfamily protein [Striga asiatica]|uniref:S-adenosyl-L-methionine-dependentmethyltransferases superfamily protein n=1 Tax=Striga asiatica TaxID=4170 RepID=A0A5A7PCQ1_STRAF|nr:S-adenosyl-L-methionine-dependentmethyltransferases superfamily protein [Striga asiatica]
MYGGRQSYTTGLEPKEDEPQINSKLESNAEANTSRKPSTSAMGEQRKGVEMVQEAEIVEHEDAGGEKMLTELITSQLEVEREVEDNRIEIMEVTEVLTITDGHEGKELSSEMTGRKGPSR